MSMNDNSFLYVWSQRENITAIFGKTLYDKHFMREYVAISFSSMYETKEKTLL
jgi:hypothetical protein